MNEKELKLIRLEPEKLKDRSYFALYMKQELGLEGPFSGNLDALADYLSEVTQETVFEVDSGSFYRFAQDQWMNRLLQMLSSMAQENPHLHLYLTDR